MPVRDNRKRSDLDRRYCWSLQSGAKEEWGHADLWLAPAPSAPIGFDQPQAQLQQSERRGYQGDEVLGPIGWEDVDHGG